MYSPILFDFIKLKISFNKEGRTIELEFVGIVLEIIVQSVFYLEMHQNNIYKIDFNFHVLLNEILGGLVLDPFISMIG